MINVTETAASKITELLAEEQKDGSGLRVFVQGGGCSGFQYGLMIDEGGGFGDQIFESNGVKLYVDPISVRYLGGAEVDFVDTVTGGGFTIKNPNAVSTCGCGSVVQRLDPVRGAATAAGWSDVPPPTSTSNRPPARGRQALGQARSDRQRLPRQEGHLSADDLVDLIRREDHRISRATVYRTLQWMVDAGIARKVDFGEGRFRFEHSYRHPRHFHLICKSCNQSSEFLSSDIEALIEEIATARNFAARQSVLQIYGECEDCRTGRRGDAGQRRDDGAAVCAGRAAHRDRDRAQRASSSTHAPRAITRDARGRAVFQKLAEEEKEHLGTLEARYKQLLERDPQLESRPTFLFFKGAANGLFSEGAERLTARRERPAGAT